MIAPILTASEVADLLKCSIRTVEDHARACTLPGIKFGDGWIFPSEALIRAVNNLAETRQVKTPEVLAVKKSYRPNLALLG